MRGTTRIEMSPGASITILGTVAIVCGMFLGERWMSYKEHLADTGVLDSPAPQEDLED